MPPSGRESPRHGFATVSQRSDVRGFERALSRPRLCQTGLFMVARRLLYPQCASPTQNEHLRPNLAQNGSTMNGPPIATRAHSVTARSHKRAILVSAAQTYPCSVGLLWQLAGNPHKVSDAVPMLRSFDLPEGFRSGCPVEEVHTILGWPQRYVGQILRVLPMRAWAMASSPRGPGPFPLPHEVLYRFQDQPGGSAALTVICRCEPGGLLRLWPSRLLVKWFLRRTVTGILRAVERMLAFHSLRGGS